MEYNMLFANNTQAATALFVLGMMFIILAVLRGTKKNLERAKRRQAKAIAACDEETLELRPFYDRPAQLSRWEVEMHDLAREITGRLDTKIAMLQQLIIAADEKIQSLAEMQKTLEKSQSGRNSSEAAEQKPSVVRRDRLAEIYRLADEGYPTPAIAEKLHSPIGDVEMILSLPRN